MTAPPLLLLIGRRVGAALITLVCVSLAVFAIAQLMEGDVAEAILGQSATPEALAGLRKAMHLDQPAWERYVDWAGGVLTGDLGRSLITGLPMREMIGARLGNSLTLAGLTALVSVPLALTLGIATLAVMLFAVTLRWLPALSSTRDIHSGWDMVRVFALPVFSLACFVMAQMVRMTRAAVIDALDTSYCEAARLKGCSPARVVLRHALPNAIGPIANAIALSLSTLLGGVIVVAIIFCTAYLILVTTADIVAILSNPRLRHR
jgi:peptide/nickel transport system permease protein